MDKKAILTHMTTELSAAEKICKVYPAYMSRLRDVVTEDDYELWEEDFAQAMGGN